MFSEDIDSYKTLPRLSVRQLMNLRIYQALKQNDFNQQEAAKDCGISIRTVKHHIKAMRDDGYKIKSYFNKNQKRV